MERGNHAKRAFAGFVYLYDLYSFPYNVTFYRGSPSISTFTSAEIRSRRACALAIARLLQFRREFHRVSVSNRLEAEMPIRRDDSDEIKPEFHRFLFSINYQTIGFRVSFPVHHPSWNMYMTIRTSRDSWRGTREVIFEVELFRRSLQQPFPIYTG